MTFASHGLSDAPAAQLLGAIIPTPTAHSAVLPGGDLPDAVTIRGRPAAGVPAEFAEEAREERPAGGARGRDVDDRVPEAHEGEHDACCVGIGDGDGARVDEGVDAVDGGGHPGDE